MYTKQYLIPDSKNNPATLRQPNIFAPGKDRIEEAKTHLAIYLFADRFDVGALANEATSHVSVIFDQLLRAQAAQLAGKLLKDMLAQIPQSDKALRHSLFKRIADNCTDAVRDETLVSFMKTHEPTAWIFLAELATHMGNWSDGGQGCLVGGCP
jgi:hypothetical protein